MLAGAVQIIQTKSLSCSFPLIFHDISSRTSSCTIQSWNSRRHVSQFVSPTTQTRETKQLLQSPSFPNVGRKSTLLRWKLSQCHVTAHAKMIDATGAFKDQTNNSKIPFIIHLFNQRTTSMNHEGKTKSCNICTSNWFATQQKHHVNWDVFIIFWSHQGDLLESGNASWMSQGKNAI